MKKPKRTDYFYAVIGRLCGADEDSVWLGAASNREGALRAFRRYLLTGADFRSARAMLQDYELIVNTVLISRTRINMT